MTRSIFKDTLTPGSMAVVAMIGFALAFGVGAGMRLLQEAAGGNLGANAILWIGTAFLLGYIWRAVSRYRRLHRETPPDITERLAHLIPPPAEPAKAKKEPDPPAADPAD